MHTTNDVLDFLQEKFHERVISNRLKLSWPAKSPDLNPMDFIFWGAAEAELFQKSRKTIPELKAIVETYASQIPRDVPTS